VANSCLDLLQINDTGVTALNWVQSKIRRKIERARRDNLPGASVAECEKQLELTQKYWIQDLDTAPHVLVHGDLSNNNIIVDDSNTVRGIIDLGWAELVPLQFAASYPRFLTHEPDEEGSFTISGHLNDRLLRDRAFFLGCIKYRALKDDGSSIMQTFYQLLAREDQIARHWWITAASRIDIHHAMVRCDWNPKG
ncbi:hypothetical protein BN1723_004413, partial [Verticillium longisporum]